MMAKPSSSRPRQLVDPLLATASGRGGAKTSRGRLLGHVLVRGAQDAADDRVVLDVVSVDLPDSIPVGALLLYLVGQWHELLRFHHDTSLVVADVVGEVVPVVLLLGDIEHCLGLGVEGHHLFLFGSQELLLPLYEN